MNMTDIFNWIGDFSTASFEYLKAMGNTPNLIFWIAIISLLFTWLRLQAKYNKEAEQNNTLK